MSLSVSIVIPTVNRRDSVLRTVQSALQQTLPVSAYEIVVVIDGVDDGSAAALRGLDTACPIRVVELDRNQGPSAARNAGWRSALGSLILFLDDDILCTPGLVKAHVDAHQAEAGDELIAGFGGIYIPADQPPSLAAESFRLGLGAVYLHHRDHPTDPWPETVWSFANTSVARTVLESSGGFDERLCKREDGELGMRLIKTGVRQRFIPEAVGYQVPLKSAEQLVHDAEVSAGCDLLFLQIHPEWTPHDFVMHLREEGAWKRRARRILSNHLEFADLLLRPLCSLGKIRGIPRPLQILAVRTLLFRCGLHWYRRLTEISPTGPEILMQSAGTPEGKKRGS